MDFLKAYQQIGGFPAFSPVYYIETFTRLKDQGMAEAELLSRILAARLSWRVLNERVLGDAKLADFGDDYGCNLLQTEEKLRSYVEKSPAMRKFFRQFECRIVRDVGTNKYMACVVAAFDEEHVKFAVDMPKPRDVK